MNEKEFIENAKAIFAPRLKGIFFIFPIKGLVKERSFIITVFLSVTFSILSFFICLNNILDMIEKIINLIIAIVPAILGLSLAGFAIVINQINTETLERTAIIKEKGTSSLYQKTNAAFAIMCLTQLIALIVATLLTIIMPISKKITVPCFIANSVNIVIIFLLTFICLYALFSGFDTIYAIFNSGQLANFMFLKNKLDKK